MVIPGATRVTGLYEVLNVRVVATLLNLLSSVSQLSLCCVFVSTTLVLTAHTFEKTCDVHACCPATHPILRFSGPACVT